MRTSQVSGSSRIDNRALSRIVVLMIVAAALFAVLFGVYYYVDRYVRFGDRSPVERQIKQLEEVLASDSEDVGARLSIAQLYYENGDYSKAIQYAEPVLDAHPGDPAPLFLLGIVYSEAGQVDEAVGSLERLVAIRRESPMAQVDRVLETSLYYLGSNYLKLNRADDAIGVLKEALDIDETDADVLYQLGVAYNQKGEYERSIEAYQSAVRFVPDFTEAYQGMAKAYDALGLPSKALYAQGMTSFSSKEYGKAQQYLERAAQDLPDFVPVYLGLALTYEQQGDFGLARKNIARALELEPDNFNANVISGRLASSNGEE
jgi:tetratricopeptide (TPR) repeat protein